MTDATHSPRMVCLDLAGGCPRVAEPPPQVVLCLGNFDGVHIAHAHLLREGMRLSRQVSEVRKETVASGVLCFFSPSGDAFRPTDAPPYHLTTLAEKLRLIAEIGVRYAYLCDFTDIRALSPVDFIRLLTEHMGCVGVVCGDNYRFGARAVGAPSLLSAHFGQDAAVILPEMKRNGLPISSTTIRDHLWRGDAEGAHALLGRPYSLTATVTHGKQLGRTLGFPTANQCFPPEALVPAHGVYAALCHTPEGRFPAVANVGCRPTVDRNARINCESFLLGYNGDLYGRRMRTELLTYLRPETRFSDISALREAIARDARDAEAYMRAHGLLP